MKIVPVIIIASVAASACGSSELLLNSGSETGEKSSGDASVATDATLLGTAADLSSTGESGTGDSSSLFEEDQTIQDASAEADVADPPNDLGLVDDPEPVYVGDLCTDSDPHRLFFNDMESGEIFGNDPSHHFGSRTTNDEELPRYAIVPGAKMGARGGNVLRGNMWEYVHTRDPDNEGLLIRGDRAVDALALEYGKTVYGAKAPTIGIRLSEIGIRQYPPADASVAPDGTPAEVYISVWLWMDSDFTFDAYHTYLEPPQVKAQTVKLFYAFGANNTMWVTTTNGHGGQNFLNVNNLGAWAEHSGRYYDGSSKLGRWTHWEFYMKSETQPLYYEYGAFSRSDTLLARDCVGLTDYTTVFPVPGTNPMRCLSPSEALEQNSKDGIYIIRVDGEVVLNHESMAWNGRFGFFDFPAYHGGGGQAIGTAGWALDDVCVRDRPPADMLQ